jgi:subtilisin family serine protease
MAVAVIDTPADWLHELLHPYLDAAALNNASFKTEGGQEKTLGALQREYMEQMRADLRAGRFKSQLAMDQALGAAADAQPPSLVQKIQNNLTLRLGAAKLAHWPQWRAEFDRLNHYLHGTHVAGLVISGLSPQNYRLITIPYGAHFLQEEKDKQLKFSQLLMPGRAVRRAREESESFHRAITQVFHENHVKVVNLSYSSTLEETRKVHRQYGGILGKTLFAPNLARLSREITAMVQEQRRKFYESNPDTVFVVAAGNNHKGLKPAQTESDTSAITAPNVLVVAATDSTGKLAEFSNHGHQIVHIAAPGVDIPSARFDGGTVLKSGTSMASPIVANGIAQVRFEHPELSAPDAIKYFLQHNTRVNTALPLSSVTDSRFFPSAPEYTPHKFLSDRVTKLVDLPVPKLERLARAAQQTVPQYIEQLTQQKLAQDPELAQRVLAHPELVSQYQIKENGKGPMVQRRVFNETALVEKQTAQWMADAWAKWPAELRPNCTGPAADLARPDAGTRPSGPPPH